MSVKDITDNEFESIVKEGMVLVDFYTTFCAPCKKIAVILDELNQEIGDKITMVKINADYHSKAASILKITSVPAIVIFQDGKPINKMIGFQSSLALLKVLDRYVTGA